MRDGGFSLPQLSFNAQFGAMIGASAHTQLNFSDDALA